MGEQVTTTTQRKELAAEHTSLLVLLAACVGHYWITLTLTSGVALDVDPINLLYGMREFNIEHHAPHPPGYLAYVWLLRGLHALIGGDPFQAADGHRLVFHATAATRRLAGTIADSPQNCREHIRFPVQHVGLGEFALRYQANIVRHIGVRGASPLAVDNFVEVLRLGGIGWLHSKTTRRDLLRCCPDISAVQNRYFA